jgi:hypothetical protein
MAINSVKKESSVLVLWIGTSKGAEFLALAVCFDIAVPE